VLGGLAAVALLRFRWAILAIAACGQMLWAAQAVKLAHSDPSRPPAATGALLLIAFLCGNLGYMFRDRIVLSWPIFGLCVLVSCVLAGLPSGGLYLAFPVAYITVCLGLLNPPGNRFLASGDYSYGLFLYGFPIQQAVAHIWPATHFWLANVAIAFPAALLFAFVSWHTVEKPALALRRFVPAVETRLIRLFGRKASSAPAGSGAAAPRSRIAAGCMIVAVLGGVLALVDGQDLAGVAALLAAFAVLVLAGRMTQPR
jgi:peptidoglycan/LPS O-acetylase OafA/YrhL